MFLEDGFVDVSFPFYVENWDCGSLPVSCTCMYLSSATPTIKKATIFYVGIWISDVAHFSEKCDPNKQTGRVLLHNEKTVAVTTKEVDG